MSFESSFLPHKLPKLQREKGVEKTIERENTIREVSNERMVPNNPEERIDTYLNRLHKLFLHHTSDNLQDSAERSRERNIELIFTKLCEKFLIKELPESYIDLQKRIARERGRGDIYVTDEMKVRMLETLQADQRQSLKKWVTYLSSKDALYPDWFKYFALRNILQLSQFDKELGHFKKRTSSTVAPFPDIYRDALARVCDNYTQALQIHDPKKTKNPGVRELFDAKFADLYATEIQRSLEANIENRENIEGIWTRYAQTEQTDFDNDGYFDGDEEEYMAPAHPDLNDDFDANAEWNDAEHDVDTRSGVTKSTQKFDTVKNEFVVQENQARQLYDSITGKGTGWCTEGYETAKGQLSGGDFYVYYTNDSNGNPIQPRIAIRMEGDEIGEVRGILSGQEMEPILQEVLDSKLEQFGDKAERYRNASADMKRLTNIDNKVRLNEDLTIDELKFLYETEKPIQGFGYGVDPRVHEILNKRDKFIDKLFIINGYHADVNLESVNELINAGEIDIVVTNLNKLRPFLNTLMHKIVYAGGEELLREQLFELGPFSTEEALTIIEYFGETKMVNLITLESFEQSQIDLIVLLRNTPSRDLLNKRLAKLLETSNHFDNDEQLKQILVTQLISTGLLKEVVEICTESLNPKIGVTMIRNGYINVVIENSSQFTGSGVCIVKALEETGLNSSEIQYLINPEKATDDDYIELYAYLRKTCSASEFLGKFKSVTMSSGVGDVKRNEVFQKIIAEGYAEDLVKWVTSKQFVGGTTYSQETGEMLIDLGYVEHVLAMSSPVYPDNKLFQKMIANGYVNELIEWVKLNHKNNNRGVYTQETEEMLIDLGYVEHVLAMSSPTYTNSKLIMKMIECGYSDNVIEAIENNRIDTASLDFDTMESLLVSSSRDRKTLSVLIKNKMRKYSHPAINRLLEKYSE